MPANELGGRMNYNVSSKFNRAQQIRAWERIIHDQRNAVLMGNARNRFDIQYISLWITEGLSI
ncbi:hypothetical protein D3C80_2095380 [compost metagenome]